MKNVLMEHLYHKPAIDPEELFKTLLEYREMVKPFVCDVSNYLHNAIKEGKNILLEGQLGSLKDNRSRNLSYGYLFFHTGSIRRNWSRYSSI